jgi:hypothetical protein
MVKSSRGEKPVMWRDERRHEPGLFMSALQKPFRERQDFCEWVYWARSSGEPYQPLAIKTVHIDLMEPL